MLCMHHAVLLSLQAQMESVVKYMRIADILQQRCAIVWQR